METRRSLEPVRHSVEDRLINRIDAKDVAKDKMPRYTQRNKVKQQPEYAPMLIVPLIDLIVYRSRLLDEPIRART